MPYSVILLRILLSAILSGMVGFEREVHGRAAGLRTHILVGVGSTLFMLTSIATASNYAHLGQVDPSRIGAQVVTGIGFLGAGAILRYGASIRGLTTAASIWAMAAIGLSVGAGQYVAGLITTVVVITVLILSRLEERMELKKTIKKIRISLDPGSDTDAGNVREIIETYGGRIKHTSQDDADKNGKRVIILDVMVVRAYYREIRLQLESLPGVESVSWQ
ncbi:MAG: MgtC/SapB family protein [Candidatus Omnitrophica bacterium]|nr:MgtC/SapB family protein [Candidatus Omnitrophota bacterium]